MKVSDILTLVAVLAAGASAYFAYDGWQDLAGKPFDEPARNPKKFTYTPKTDSSARTSTPSKAPLVPIRISRGDMLKDKQGALQEKEADLAAKSKELASLKEKNEAYEVEKTGKVSERFDLQDQTRKLKGQIEDNKAKIDKFKEATAVAGRPEDLKRIVEENIRRLNEANASLAREKDTLEATLQRKASLEDGLASLRRKETMQQSGEMEPNFRTTVREVFSRWGFVVINGGGSKGVNARAKLQVQRGGAKIADLQVTTVEPTVAVCAIIPGSTVGDALIAPGDTVVVIPVASNPVDISAPAPAAPAAPAGELPIAAPAAPAGF